MCSILDPLKPFAIDMVLMDVEGGKIQASIPKPMMKKFKNTIMEGQVYTMMNFGVIRSAGNYRASKHEYKLLFSGKTRVFLAQSELIPLNGLSLVNTDDVAKTNVDSNYLINLVGLLTAVSGEKELITEGRMIQLELTDEKQMILSIVPWENFSALYLVRCVVIQNVNNTSRILWNADIEEVNDFRNWLAINGIDPTLSMGDLLVGSPVIPLADDFLKIVSEEDSRAATIDKGGLYYCSNCCTHVVEVTPRFKVKVKVKVEVCHWDETAVFVLFDSDVAQLLGKSCKELLVETKDIKSVVHPPEFINLVGKALLSKVEKGPEYAFSYDDSFKVKKVYDDPKIITKFKDIWGIATPRKTYVLTIKFLQLKFDPPFPTTVDGDNLQCACETSSEDFEVLLDTRVTSESTFEASSSSGAQFQVPIPKFAPDEEEDGGVLC
ncbi:Nucleic acid-binding, OB-fold [Sesbania bispinosa]|nr:Nucleic acid-binding, OB-fold [Sesbania bispinosa]